MNPTLPHPVSRTIVILLTLYIVGVVLGGCSTHSRSDGTAATATFHDAEQQTTAYLEVWNHYDAFMLDSLEDLEKTSPEMRKLIEPQLAQI